MSPRKNAQPANRDVTVTFEDARLLFRNFAGAEKEFNRKGDRNFSIKIDDPDVAQQLQNDGWNVKPLKPWGDDPDNEPGWKLDVKVTFGKIPPQIMMITGGGRTLLDENTAGLLDFAEITNCDLIIRAYDWEVNGKTGRSAYLKKLYATVYEDELERKYRGINMDHDEEPQF